MAELTQDYFKRDPERTCQHCIGFHEVHPTSRDGECRAHAPKPDPEQTQPWPRVNRNDWCLEFKKRPRPYQQGNVVTKHQKRDYVDPDATVNVPEESLAKEDAEKPETNAELDNNLNEEPANESEVNGRTVPEKG